MFGIRQTNVTTWEGLQSTTLIGTTTPKTQTEDTTSYKQTSGRKHTHPWRSKGKGFGNTNSVCTRECKFCGTVHEMKKSACPAVGKNALDVAKRDTSPKSVTPAPAVM